ncbi:MAG TPA: ATP-binding protein [Candidatus Acidoferrales bacterium]|nr:ATP-binding protein [Candidatus Acidoferrales bacterium]
MKKMKDLTHERRIQLLSLAAGLPGSLVALILLWTGPYSSRTAWTLTILIVLFWMGFAVSLRQRVVFSLQTLSNLLAAMREEDFSIRARGARFNDALGEVMREVNALSATLRAQRMGALEATALLRAVMEEIDVAVFTFDDTQKLKLVNRAGERLLGRPAERLLDLTAEELGLARCLEGASARTMEVGFPGGSGRWAVRRGTFRQGGRPHQLIVLTDLSRALREEERLAWQRLIRVMGHELNNSLAPIQSVAESLESQLRSAATDGGGPSGASSDLIEDMRHGLSIIRSRTEALSRFMAAYARLARLPKPTLAPVELAPVIHRVASLETRLRIAVADGPPLTISADGDQIEQLLINLVRNATDASLETGGAVQLGWKKNARYLEVWVNDEGPGLPNTANLFVPFFTTKSGGSGIGLVLSRQIAEAHGGSLTLENRHEGHGCQARLRLPL